MSRQLEEYTTITSTANWIPSEAWADLILEASVCYGSLSGVISAVDYDLAAGNGNDVLVRYMSARSAQGPISEGDCMSVASSTFNKATITIQAYGDYDEVTGMALYQTKGPVKDVILTEMAKGLAKKRDAMMMQYLSTGMGGSYHILKSKVSCSATGAEVIGGCCSVTSAFYNSVVTAVCYLKGLGYNPDTLIVHPSIEKYFYMKDNASFPVAGLTYDKAVPQPYIFGLRIISSCASAQIGCINARTKATSKGTIGIVLDSSRAIGEAWGKRPTFEEQRYPECDKWRETVWMYWGCNVIDSAAICHITNP